ncbi:Aste57867_24307 [Aphanomyces stellatus]|uniref:Aste57867_24307 protein n=1 Tax=Aphanomyces stellatus TaxID=120398 RepID=A0A485LQ40_9STRA|nr:hypothetical protein As57867_024232 [Aphanomyces stellatus]VFU00947.1 Aste57867_24307 [Aphanomyces stellatus]
MEQDERTAQAAPTRNKERRRRRQEVSSPRLPLHALHQIAWCVEDAASFFVFLDVLGSATTRGPLEPIWQASIRHSRTRLWPRLDLRTMYDPDLLLDYDQEDLYWADNAAPPVHLEPIVRLYRHVIVRDLFDLAWLRRHLHPQATITWRFDHRTGCDGSPVQVQWFTDWAALPITCIKSTKSNAFVHADGFLDVMPCITGLHLRKSACFSLESIVDHAIRFDVQDLELDHVVGNVEGRRFSVEVLERLMHWLTMDTRRHRRTFCVGGGGLGDDDDSTRRATAVFVSAMCQCRTLHMLRLIEWDVRVLPLDATSVLAMRDLILDFCHLDRTTLQLLGDVLTRSRSVTRLTILGCDFTTPELVGGLDELVTALTQTSVTQLRIGKCLLRERRRDTMLPWLGLTRLDKLTLDKNKLRDDDAIAIAQVMNESHMRVLDVRGNKIGFRGADALLDSVLHHVPFFQLVLGTTDRMSKSEVDQLHAKARGSRVELHLMYPMPRPSTSNG